MDPFGAVGLAASIVAFIDFSTKLVKGAIKIHESVDGSLGEDRNRRAVATEMKLLSAKLLPPDGSQLQGEEKELALLAAECRSLSLELIQLIDSITPKDVSSKSQCLWAAAKGKVREKDKLDLEKRLDSCRSQLELQLMFLTSRETRSFLRELTAAAQKNTSQLEQLRRNVDQLRRGIQVDSISENAQGQLRQLFNGQEETLHGIVQERILNGLKFEGMHRRYDMVDEAHSKTFQWIFGKEDEANCQLSDGSSDSGLDEDHPYGLDENDDGRSVHSDKFEPDTESDVESAGDWSTNGSINSGTKNLAGQIVYSSSEAGIIALEVADSEDSSETSSQRGEEADSRAPEVIDSEDSSSDTSSQSYDSTLYSHDDSPPQSGMDEFRREAIKRLRSWLSSGDGIFHISGKLGSGKSTLMKFLYCHPGTNAELSKWAGDRKLVFANFFFWRPGNRLQTSLAGLYRSLLHDMLRACPDLIPEVLPNHWRRQLETSWQSRPEFDISEKEVEVAFTQLVRHRTLYNRSRFCFFIDGLDEYVETAQNDYLVVVKLLADWTTASFGDMKICVSSREDNVFMNAFPSETRLRLHDLTLRDMEAYVRDRLSHVPDDDGLRAYLVAQIPSKAQGIFLWVALVVREVREQLENGAQLDGLRNMLDSLPDELEDLIENILTTSTKWNRRRAYRTFAMIAVCKSVDLSLTPLAYSFWEEYEKDQEFSSRQSFLEDAGSATIQERTQRSRKNANGWCKGLVETKYDELDYAHRSIAEFLQGSKFRKELCTYTDGFNIPDAISQLLLAAFRIKPLHLGRLCLKGMARILGIRHRACLDQEPYSFLECLDSTLKSQRRRKPRKPGEKLMDTFIWTGSRGWLRVPMMSRRHLDINYYECEDLLSACLILGMPDYPFWKMATDPRTTSSGVDVALTHHVVYVHNIMLKGPRNMMVWEDSRLRPILLEGSFHSRRERQWSTNPAGTNHVCWLLSEVFLRAQMYLPVPECPEWYLWLKRQFGTVVESALSLGMDPRLSRSIVVYTEVDVPRRGSWRVHVQAVLHFEADRRLSNITDHKDLNHAPKDVPRVDRQSLRDWIIEENPPNRDRVLRLIDENTARLEREEGKMNADESHFSGGAIRAICPPTDDSAEKEEDDKLPAVEQQDRLQEADGSDASLLRARNVHGIIIVSMCVAAVAAFAWARSRR